MGCCNSKTGTNFDDVEKPQAGNASLRGRAPTSAAAGENTAQIAINRSTSSVKIDQLSQSSPCSLRNHASLSEKVPDAPGDYFSVRSVKSDPDSGAIDAEINTPITSGAAPPNDVGSTAPPPSSEAPGVCVNDPITVLPTGTEPDVATPEDIADLPALRDRFSRFRVLIIGKANAGKTTILQKICNTEEQPIVQVQDQRGRAVNSYIIDPTDGRGIHDINHELIFSSNPRFVFHDSAGFEAGAIQEIEDVRNFITKRATFGELRHQLHAIWYCLPSDNSRPLSEAEMTFFEQGTGRVPVIAIFTKYDGMIADQYNQLRYDHGYSKVEAQRLAPVKADELFRNSEFYVKRLQAAPYPPARYLRVQEMHKPENDCSELSRQTLEALDSRKLKLLFVSVQQSNIELCTEHALKWYIVPALVQAKASPWSLEAIIAEVKKAIVCYGHLLYNNHDYSRDLQREFNREEFREGLLDLDIDDDFEELAQILESTIPLLAGQGPSYTQITSIGTGILIIAEDSFWLKKSGLPGIEAFEQARNSYRVSGRCSAVINEVDEQLHGVNFQDLGEKKQVELVQVMQGIIRKFRVDA